VGFVFPVEMVSKPTTWLASGIEKRSDVLSSLKEEKTASYGQEHLVDYERSEIIY
jgi:hypothetical protein